MPINVSRPGLIANLRADGFTVRQATASVDTILRSFEVALRTGAKINLSKICVISTRIHKATKYKLPNMSGEVPERRALHIRQSKLLKLDVDCPSQAAV